MKRIRALLEFLGAFLLIFILLFSIVSLVIVKFYGDQVQQLAMESINDRIDTKVSAEEIGISIFRDFPNTSVFLNDVRIWSGHGFERKEFGEQETDLLLQADRIYVKFNLLQLVRKDFRIKGFELRSATCILLSDSNGNTNYSIVKQAKETKESEGEARIQLKDVQLKDVEVIYLNKAKEVETGIHAQQVQIDGNFGKDHFGLKSKGEFVIHLLQNQNITYLKDEKLKTDLSLSVNENHFSIEKGILELGGMKSSLDGEFVIDPEFGADLDLRFIGERINLAMVSDLLRNLSPDLDIRSSGALDVSGNIEGLLSSTITPHVEVSFEGRDASFLIPGSNEKLKDIYLEGYFSNGHLNHARSSTLSIPSLESSYGNSRIRSSLNLQNLLQPKFDVSIEGSLEIADIMNFIPELALQFHSGKIEPTITVSGGLSSMNSNLGSASLNATGNVAYSDVSISFKNNDLRVDSIRGRLELAKDKWKLLSDGMLASSDLSLILETSNLLKAGTEKLTMRGTIEGSGLDLTKILDQTSTGQKAKTVEEAQVIAFPQNIQAELDFNFRDVLLGEIEAHRFHGTFSYKYPQISLYPVYLETLEGAMNSNISLQGLDQSDYTASVKSHIRNLDISELFASFNNFGQDFLSSDNIDGKISGEVDFKTSLSKDFKVATEDIVSRSDIVISKGELIHFEPMIELSKFLKIDKMDRIEFSTIHNTIEIRDNAIQIPQMDIESSVFHMQASGNHGFDKTFEYHLGVRLSELLFNKAKSSRNKEFEVALDEDDQRTVFLLIYDEGKGLEIDFDEDQAMKKIRSDLKEEKTELKVILNEEFGMFKKDSSVIEQRKKEEGPKFRFDFDEDEGADSTIIQEEKPKWWKRKKSEDKKAEFEYVIDLNPN